MSSTYHQYWTLDPGVTFLNHGSFGATPRAVLETQRSLQSEMEREPLQFLWRHLPRRLAEARNELARFLKASSAGLAFVPNSTAGVNSVLRSVKLEPGDELLTTDHAYNACRCALDEAATRTGATVVVAPVPLPIDSADEALAAILGSATRRTRLAMIDHVTSPTALVLPIERIVRELEALGIDTLVDGAHAPGMLDLDLGEIRPAWYTGNLHKWVCAPKGAGFLWTREDLRESTRPSVISHGWNTPRPGSSRYHELFDWTGTFDPTAWLGVPEAIRHLEQLHPDGWPGIRRDNRTMILQARRMLTERLSIQPPCPEEMLGSMATLPLPGALHDQPPISIDPLQLEWFDRHRIEMPIMPHAGRRWFRISAHLYNSIEDYERVVEVLR